MLARGRYECCSVVENVKTAARNPWRNIAAAEAQGVVRPPNGIREKPRAIAVGIDSVFRKENGIIIRERKSHYFIKPHAGAHETSVYPAYQPLCVGSFR